MGIIIKINAILLKIRRRQGKFSHIRHIELLGFVVGECNKEEIERENKDIMATRREKYIADFPFDKNRISVDIEVVPLEKYILEVIEPEMDMRFDTHYDDFHR